MLAWHNLNTYAQALRRSITLLVREAEKRTDTSIGAAHVDAYLAFTCKAFELTASTGSVGFVLSGGFAKNPAALPVRSLWLVQASGAFALHFDNKRRLFADLPSIIEFSLLVSRKRLTQDSAACRIGLHLTTFEDLLRTSQFRIASPHRLAASGLLTLPELAAEVGGLVSDTSLWTWLLRETSHILQEVYPSKTQCHLVQELGYAGTDVRFDPFRGKLLERGSFPC